MAAAEAKEHENQAEKALKPSWMSLKFQPDYMLASMEYGQAATKYRAAGMLKDSVRMHIKSAELKEMQGDQFSAGRAYEQAAAICDGKPEIGDAEAYWIPAARAYRLAGKGESASKLLLKLAALREKQGRFDKAKEAFEESLEIFAVDEKDYQVSDVYKGYIAFLVRAEMFEEAFVALDGYIIVLVAQGYQPFACKEILSKVVLCLWMGDTVRAELALNSNDNVNDWLMSNEAAAGFELVKAFQEYDAEAVVKIVKQQVFTFLQVEVARLAQKLRIQTQPAAPAAPAPAMASPKMAAPSNAAAESSAGYAADLAPVAAPDPAPGSADPAPEPAASNLGELLM